VNYLFEWMFFLAVVGAVISIGGGLIAAAWQAFRDRKK